MSVPSLPGGAPPLLPIFGNNKPALPGGLQPPGLNLPDDGDDGTRPSDGDPLDLGGHDPLRNGLPGSAPNGGLPGPGGVPNPITDAPLLNPDNPASRLLQGQSAQGNGVNAFGNNATQFPPPTLSERALNGAQYAMLDRPASYSAVPAAVGVQSASAPVAGLPQAAGTVPTAVAANTGTTAPALSLVAASTPNAVPAAPMAAALSQDALAAQQSLFARLNTMQHVNLPANATANAPAPPSETPATLQSVTTNTVANDPRALPLTGNERAIQQRGDAPNPFVYSGDGAARRLSRRGGKVDNATLSHWLWSFGRGGTHRPTHEPEPDLQVVRALQWLFWILTICAYGCLVMAIVLMLPSGSLVSERASTGGSGIALLLGVVVAAGAWWLGRRLNRR